LASGGARKAMGRPTQLFGWAKEQAEKRAAMKAAEEQAQAEHPIEPPEEPSPFYTGPIEPPWEDEPPPVAPFSLAGAAARSALEALEPEFPPPWDTLAPGAKASITRAATASQLTVDDFRARQREIVRQRMAGVAPAAIGAKLGIGSRWQVVKTLQHARAAGVAFPPLPSKAETAAEDLALSLDADLAEEVGLSLPDRMVPPDPAITLDPKLVFQAYEDLEPQAKELIQVAAKHHDLTPQAFCELRLSVVYHRLEGRPAAEIAKITGIAQPEVQELLAFAGASGVQFPPHHEEVDI
jgi:hypothetical protein